MRDLRQALPGPAPARFPLTPLRCGPRFPDPFPFALEHPWPGDSPPSPLPRTPKPVADSSVQVSLAGHTDVGRTRDHNEDTFLVADLSTGEALVKAGLHSKVAGPRGLLLMVADGMGGAAAGELASALAAETIHGHLRSTWTKESAGDIEHFALRIREAVEQANARIHEYALAHTDVRGMGTTVTAAGVFDGHLFLAQVGDSRAYLVRQGQATLLTKDQSFTQRMVDVGGWTEEQAERSDRKNIILQALGPTPEVRVDLTHEPLHRGDLLILCSDGLSNQVKREEFAEHAGRIENLEELCSQLIEVANARGGPDNITVVAARFGGPGLPEPSTAPAPGHHVFPLPDDEPVELDARAGFPTGEIRPADRPAVTLPAAAEGAPSPTIRPRLPVGRISAAIIAAAVLLYYLLTR